MIFSFTLSHIIPLCRFLQVLAIDRDTGENGRVTYSIKSGKGKAKFRINADTGVIYAAKPFETDAEYDISVRAEDNGLPKKSQTVLVSVIVVDTPTSKENVNPPQIKTNDQRVEVTENDNPGFLVTLIQAYDEDNDQLWFDIIGMYLFCPYLFILLNHIRIWFLTLPLLPVQQPVPRPDTPKKHILWLINIDCGKRKTFLQYQLHRTQRTLSDRTRIRIRCRS